MRNRFCIVLSFCMAILASPSSYGGGIPVIDAANLAKMAEEMLLMQQQLDQMSESYAKQLEQLDQAVQQTGALTGSRNMGSLLNGAEEAQMRHFVPNDINDLIGGSKNLNGSSIPHEYASLKQEYQPLTLEDFGENNAGLPVNAAYPKEPRHTIGDVIDWTYSGNKLHPTQKPLPVLLPLIETFSAPGGLVLDPFAGSGSTLLAARMLGRNYLGIELDAGYHAAANERLELAA